MLYFIILPQKPAFLSIMRERKGVDPHERVCEEEVGGVGKREMVIRIGEENLFSMKEIKKSNSML